MRKHKLLRTALTSAAVVGLSLGAGSAYATPSGPGVSSKLIAQTTIGHTDYILRQITLPAHQSTGWHFHDGTLYGHVEQGTLSHFHSDCTSDGVYHAGQNLIEPAGSDKVHIGRNLGDTPVVLDVLYVLPHGAPLSEDAPNPGCDFQ